jgi:hypothetical protein
MLVFGVHLEFLLDVVEIIDEIMLSVSLYTVWWRTDFPIFSQGFSSHVQLKELLDLVVGAPKPILQPGDRYSLKNQTEDQASICVVIEVLVL